MADRIRVAVVDDHPLLREGVAGTLRSDEGLEVVAIGGSGAEAITIAGEFKPDVILLDISMPGGGIEAARAIADAYPMIKAIMPPITTRNAGSISVMRRLMLCWTSSS